MHRVYHGLNDDFSRLLEQSPPERPRNGRLRLLGVGRLVEKKGFDVFVEACALLERRGVAFEATIVGEDGDHGGEVRRRIAERGLSGRVVLAGPKTQAELLDAYGRADALCLPCRIVDGGDRDGIPNVLVEAMACGVPGVSTAISGIPELIEDGRNGLLVAPDDPEAVAAALIRLEGDHELAARLSTAARATVRERFDGDLLTGEMADLFGVIGVTAHAQSVRSAGARVRPRSVFCVIDPAYRDRAVAEEVCAGRFTHAGVALDLGLEPDWLGARLPADEEWRIEWVKFYYGLDLAHAHRLTGEARFRAAFERLVRSWIEQVEPDHDPSEVTARRISNWIYAWCRFDGAAGFGGFADGLEDELLASLQAQAAHVRRNLTPARNHRTLELYSLLVLALALPDLDPDGTLLELGFEGLQENLLADVRPDGVHCEASSHYHMIVLRSALGARENARRFGLRTSPAFDERLERACEFALACHRPDGEIAMLSDGDAGSYPDLLERAAALLRRQDFLYAASGGERGTPPAAPSTSFPDGGYHVQRSGWGERRRAFAEELYLIFDCGPLGEGGHGHYDLLSVEVAGGGRPLLVDPGRFTYSEEPPNLRRWFKGTAAHNTVCVDGRDQTPYRRGKPKGSVAEGRLLGRLTGPGFDLLRGEARSPCYDAVHERAIAFVARRYWVVVDRLRAGDPHSYDLRFHLAPEAHGATQIVRGDTNTVVRAPGVGLAFPHAVEPRLLDGWHAPAYGAKLEAPVVSLVAEDVAEHEFQTLIVPSDDDAARLPEFRGLAAPGADARLIEVMGGGGRWRDVIAWSESRGDFELGPLRCRGRARVDARERGRWAGLAGRLRCRRGLVERHGRVP